jgi:hypothetical protein
MFLVMTLVDVESVPVQVQHTHCSIRVSQVLYADLTCSYQLKVGCHRPVVTKCEHYKMCDVHDGNTNAL